MHDHRLSPQHEEPISGTEKKLRKREQRMKDRLQEAQLAQANALERLRRAEARYQKRAARVQRLEGRLNLLDQQMLALNAPPSTVVTLIPSVPESSVSEVEEPGSPVPPPETSAQQVQQEPAAQNPPTPQASVDTVPSSTSTILDNTEAEAQETELENVVHTPQPAEQATEVEPEMLAGEAEPQFLERFSAVDEIEVLADEEEDISAEEAPIPPDSSQFNAIIEQAREARAVAKAAEEAARFAIEQVADVTAYLEEVGSARHLMHELELMEAEASNAVALAQEAENAALAAERLASEATGTEEPVKLTAEEEQIIAALPTVEEQEQEAATMQAEDAPGEQPSNALQSPSPLHPTSLELAQIEEIDEEEEVIETVAAMIIADAAAIAAAEAEALAEASSARTREARFAAQRADHALASVREAIRSGLLSGEAAEVALKAAERDATHAHALLADAEANEERALNTAMNAEAEAEVAEGMAFAAGDRNERDEKLRDEFVSTHPASANGLAPITTETDTDNDDVDLELDEDDDEDDDGGDDEDDDDDEEDTVEMPIVRPENA